MIKCYPLLSNAIIHELKEPFYPKTQKGSTWHGTTKEGISSRQFIKSFPFEPKTFVIDVIETEVSKGDWEFEVKDKAQLKKVSEYYDFISTKNNMKHIHLFQHIGGGCSMGSAVKNDDAQCDDQYQCECGASFKTHSESNTHWTMPHYIAGKETPELVDINTEEPHTP